VLDRLRSRLDSYLGGVGRSFSRVSPVPTTWTLVGLALSLASGAAYYTSGYRGELLGGALILAAGWFDVVDGAVARVTGRVSKRGAFLDSTLDRVAEVAVYSGVLLGAYASPVAVLLALAGSLLVSYTRARGDALGVALSGVGVGERSERLLALALLSIAGLAGWGVVLVIILAWFAFLERTVRAAGKLA
jgi:archaetidylinositol phosphate synthase